MTPRKRKPRFKVGQVVVSKVSDHLFRVGKVIPCFDGPDNQRQPNRFEYVEGGVRSHLEDNLRALSAKECGR